MELSKLEKECIGCCHMKVCAPFRGITRMLGEYDMLQEKPPFDANHLAKICTIYFSQVIVDKLSADDNAGFL